MGGVRLALLEGIVLDIGLTRHSLSAKLAVLGAVVCAVSVTLTGYVALREAGLSLIRQEEQALDAIRSSRQQHVERNIQTIERQVGSFARSPTVVAALRDFINAFAALPQEIDPATLEAEIAKTGFARFYDEEVGGRLRERGFARREPIGDIPVSPGSRWLQWNYVVDSSFEVGKKYMLDRAAGPATYNGVHAEYHPGFRDFQQSFDYYDIFLIGLGGNVLYTVFKETDFGSNVLPGPYKSTGLAQVYRQALTASVESPVCFADFTHYEPSYGSPAGFVAAPVFDGDTLIGVAAFQLPMGTIESIMTDSHGLRRTGESYLVGPDKLMRSSSRSGRASSILTTKVDTEGVRQTLDGKSGTTAQLDYRRERVLASFAPLQIEGLDWAIVAQIDLSEVMAPVSRLRM